MTENLSFDKLPQAVTILTKEISELKQLILNNQNQSEPEQSEQFLSIQEAAQFLNLTVPTVYSKVSRGELPYMKRGKRLYFSNTELMDYVKAGRKVSESEIEQEAEAHLSNIKKGLRNGK